jgi:hypothetical protein
MGLSARRRQIQKKMEVRRVAETGGPLFEVVWPGGRRATRQFAVTPGLDNLDGKVVAELWDRVFRGDQIFPLVREQLRRRFAGVTFVDYDKFGDIFGWNESEVVRRLPDLFERHRVDAAIVGVGA